MTAIRSALIWLAVGILILVWLPLLAVVRLFDRDPARYITGRTFRLLGAAFTRINPLWRFDVGGRMPDDPRNPFVVVANHQSLVDIPVISRLPMEMKWVAKAELFRIPVVGWLMRLAGDIPVHRGDRASRAAVIRQARRYLGDGCSVMFFPEGTRSNDGRVKRFQPGAFRLAIDAGVPILPLAVDGSEKAIPKHGWQFRDEIRARVAVMEPVPTAGMTPDDGPRLAEEVRRRIIGQIADWRGVAPEDVDAAAGARSQGQRAGSWETRP